MKRTIILMSLLSMLPFWSCANPGNANDGAHITSFHYNFDGTIGGNSHHYSVRVKDGVATMTIEDMQHQDYGEMTDTVGMDFVEALEALCAKYNVREYDGFKGYDRFVCDGEGFSLSIDYDNGKEVNAHGMNEFPRGFRNFAEEMHDLFRPYCDRIMAKALAQKKAQGVSGELTFIMMNFMQRGKSGNDRYEVLISRSAIRDPNVDIRIHSESGEVFPEGDISVYKSVPDDAIDWKTVAAMVKKHQLVQWMDFDEAAEDYNNEEWFQMGLDFEQGHISACGTAHPEHYKAFRKDFLKWLKKTVEKVGKLQ